MREIVARLHDPIAKHRMEAVEQLEETGPPPNLVLMLLQLAETEGHMEVYQRLLMVLGKSGFMEVRPLIDRHILSPGSDFRHAARRALKAWLVVNGVVERVEVEPKYGSLQATLAF